MGLPLTGTQMQMGRVNIAVFDRLKSLRLSRLIAGNSCPSATEVRVYDSALTEVYAVSSTTLVFVEVCL